MTARGKYDAAQLLFRRQYVLGPRFLEGFPQWQRIEAGPSLCLTAHPDLTVSAASTGDLSIVLIGYILDPYRPEDRDEDILRRLLRHLKEGGTRDTLIKMTEPLGGRWVLLVDHGGAIWLFNDPCGCRQVFYTRGTTGPLWCTSEPGLLAELLHLSMDHEARRFFRRYRRRMPQYLWPGDTSPFKEIRHLQPNHFLDLQTGQSHRFWPDADLPAREPREVVEESARLLQGMIESASRRFDLSLTLTAGRDTRVILAASKAVCDRLFLYAMMYWDLNWNSADIQIPAKLLSHFGMAHHVIVCPPRMDRDFRQIWRRHVVTAHDTYGPIVQAECAKYPAGKSQMSGTIMPITSWCFRQILDSRHPEWNQEKPHVEMLTWLTYREDDFSRKAIGRWLACVVPRGVPILDLFYWEEEEGNWEAMTLAEWDLAHESFIPYNCRRFLMSGLSTPASFREQPDYLFHEALIRRMWPELLKEPFNPPVATTRVFAAAKRLGQLQDKIRRNPRLAIFTDAASAYQRHPWLTSLDRLISRHPLGQAARARNEVASVPPTIES